ncbi:unnamed protein product [Medioppia subpectinata]|uniref:Large ribosomal subunit protein uL16m n=1 Tax=Medioppia subpectinata TaxID=1979941 RepID=A0A7R9PUM5_9ACAR|nr:unnamed protein product [Medioppia subpectinata]CAG2100936.1 unnamed protein product [Medioppia subpectinata]
MPYMTAVCPLVWQSVRGRKFWPIPPDMTHIELPPEAERPLVAMEPMPSWHGVRPRKFPRQQHDIRGPELVNNQLLHKQYGIIALTGVELTINHINLIRTVINKHMNLTKTFAVWRIEAPWKPVSKRSQGKRLGGGKASIHHYTTPIRAGQVIVEVGGQIEFADCYYYLESISKRLPCDAFPVSQEILDEWDKEEQSLREKNINPFTFERVIKYNMQGCHRWTTMYDREWFGKYY